MSQPPSPNDSQKSGMPDCLGCEQCSTWSSNQCTPPAAYNSMHVDSPSNEPRRGSSISSFNMDAASSSTPRRDQLSLAVDQDNHSCGHGSRRELHGTSSLSEDEADRSSRYMPFAETQVDIGAQLLHLEEIMNNLYQIAEQSTAQIQHAAKSAKNEFLDVLSSLDKLLHQLQGLTIQQTE